MGARTPTAAAMAAMTLQALSGDRLMVLDHRLDIENPELAESLKTSGHNLAPQVIEGWYGIPYGKPLTRTREYIGIVRKILAREAAARAEHHNCRASTAVEFKSAEA